jgi:transposase
MHCTPHNWREARRLYAWRLKQKSGSQHQVAEALGVSERAVSQWIKRAGDRGAEALRHRPPLGAPSRLTDGPRAHLPILLQQGPEAYGFQGELWTRGRIAAVIRLTFGVSYHLTQMGACARRSPGVSKSPRRSATKRRLRTGATRPGLPSKRGGGTATKHLLHR